MKLMLICNDPKVAVAADKAGVDRIFVDLEILGKEERQGHLNTVISRHDISDVAKVRNAVPDSTLLVRVNPLNAHTKLEVDRVIDSGADLLMLPMFHDAETVDCFSKIVAGRAGIIPLVETIGAVRNIRQLTTVPGLKEIFIGLNDLHLSVGKTFMFELLADGTVESLAHVVRGAGLNFGFGGIARLREGLLPAERILGEHVRLGSSSVILSRTFFQDASRSAADSDFPLAVQMVRDEIAKIHSWNTKQFEANRQELIKSTQAIVANLARRAA